ncbi:putative sensor histidine kinase pdtaS [subsurface metagenome]
MALVHETLYKSKSMAEIELQKHIPALVDSVSRTFRVRQKIDLKVDIEDIKLSIEQASPLSLVINELISNSFKHAFPEGKGEIAINVRLRGDDEIEVVISDNGRGMPEDIDYEKSLGLQLVKGLVESQLGGTWDINTEGGTKHTIRF